MAVEHCASGVADQAVFQCRVSGEPLFFVSAG
jgi:hypothetical protein